MNDTYKTKPIRINLVQETSVFIYFIPSSTASASPLKDYEIKRGVDSSGKDTIVLMSAFAGSESPPPR